jgi:hypothetical protein
MIEIIAMAGRFVQEISTFVQKNRTQKSKEAKNE